MRYPSHQQALDALKDVLVCPVCRGALISTVGQIQCSSCQRIFAQSSGDWLDLLPADFAPADWAPCQEMCDQWYLGEAGFVRCSKDPGPLRRITS